MTNPFEIFFSWLTDSDDISTKLFLALVVYIIAQFVLAYFQHKADRRARRYERKASIGGLRFEKEAKHLEKLSDALLCLVVETEPMREYKANRFLSTEEKTRWLDLYRSAVSCLGAAAPFLNYVDLKTGMMRCGVKTDNLGEHFRCEDCKGREGLENHVFILDSRSLYMRAALLVDACTRIAQKHMQESLGTVLGRDFLKDYPEAIDAEENISVKYSHFLNCAYCRLRDCEIGSRDARWKRVKEWFFKIVVWMFPSIYHYFDPACPFENIENNTSASRKERTERGAEREILKTRRESSNFAARVRTIFFSVALIVIVVLLIIFVIWPFIVFAFDFLMSVMPSETSTSSSNTG